MIKKLLNKNLGGIYFMEYIDAWNKYKHGIWITTGIAAVIGIAGGPIGIILFAFLSNDLR